jgi:FKBP-type peptidyl-prolyl cis-trans isomerase
MLMMNYTSFNYLIQTIEQLKKPPITRGIHIPVQNISMTKGKQSEKQKKDKKVKKRMNQAKRKKKNKTKQKTKKERKKKSKQTKQTKNNPQYIYSSRTERLYFPPKNSLYREIPLV